MLLEGKTALVTGGSRGLGRAVAYRFAEEGARLVLWARGLDKLEEVREELGRKGAVVEIATVDLSSVKAIRDELERLYSHTEAIDILVNAAGVPLISELARTKEEEYDRVFNVNTKGLFFLTQGIVQRMLEKKIKGSIVNVSSVTAKTGGALVSVYAASKAAVISFTQAFSKELAPHGIRVNAICPGAMDTEMFHKDSLEAMAERFKTSYDQMLKSCVSSIPLRRILDPHEVADFITYIVSDRGAGMTGQAFNISCGLEVH
jgi:3-oxoacyl-[acyl-carrier protein] reductase